MLTEVLTQTEVDPYPGLRAFTAEEAHLFFGRDEQIDKLLEKLDKSHFVAVIGPSGCGKSSLVKAGLIPALKTGFFLSAGTKWKIAEMRPGNEPYKRLSNTLLKSFNFSDSAECIKAELKRSPKGLMKIISAENLKNKENFILIVDQFEELFRYKQNNNIDEVTGFINLLIESATQQESPIHIIITMRSDFLGQCSLFLGLPEIFNDNQFLTPRLTREQTKEAIEGPALVCGGNLEPKLVTNLLNDIGIDHDQLPLLQHSLMRMWHLAKKTPSAANNENKVSDFINEPDNNTRILTLEDYNKTGRLNEALSQHANEIYDHKLNKKQKEIAEVLFKRLSERNAEQKDNRRIATVQDIATVAHADVNEVIKVADIFRESDNSFLMPPPEVKLTAQSYLDISHESLLRQWDKMKKWIAEEYEDATLFSRLIADSDDYYKMRGELITGNDLANALTWKNRDTVNIAWSTRYSDKINQVDNYINDSRHYEKRRKNINYGIYTALVLAVIFIAVYYQLMQEKNAAEKIFLAAKFNSTLKSTNDSLKTSLDSQKQLQLSLNQSAEREIENQKKIVSSLKQENLANAKFHKSESEKNAMKTLIAERDLSIAQLKEAKYTSEIQNLPFYSRIDSVSDRTLAIKELLPFYMNNDSAASQTLIDSIDRVLYFQYQVSEDPVTSFRKLKKIWAENKRPLIQSLINQILNDNLFYKLEINPATGNFYSTPQLALSQQKDKLALSSDYNNIFYGEYKNDSLLIDEDYSNEPKQIISYTYDSVASEQSSAYEPIVAMARNNDTIVGLQNSGEVSRWVNNTKKYLLTISFNKEFQHCEFSNDGKYLICFPFEDYNYRIPASKDRSIKMYNIDNVIKGNLKSFTPLILDSSKFGIKNISFSDNNEQVLIVDNDGYAYIHKTNASKKYNNINTSEKISAATFASNYIITVSKSTAKVWGDSGKISSEFKICQLKNFDNNSNIKSIAISPDWKKLLINKSNGLTLYEKLNGDPIFPPINSNSSVSNEAIAKNFGNYQDISKADFLDSSSIVTINEEGTVRLWKIYPSFENANEAFASIETPDLNFYEKLTEDSNFFRATLKTNDEKKLYAAGLYFFDLGLEKYSDVYDQKAKRLFEKLLIINPGNKQYQGKLLIINENMNEEEKYRKTPNYDIMVKRLKQNVAIRETIIAKDSSFRERSYLGSNYWNLSWYQVFMKDFTGAIASVERGLQVDSTKNGMITNLALSYLLTNQCENAIAVYKKYKGAKYIDRDQYFTESFLQDFKDLEAAGIIKPNDKLVEKIQQYLKGESNDLDCR